MPSSTTPSPPTQETTRARTDRDATAHLAARTALWGGLVGASKGALASLLMGVGLQLYSPVFRGLTPQFKVYLFMCPMTVAGMVSADRRLREFEMRVRWERREGVRRAEVEEEEGGEE